MGYSLRDDEELVICDLFGAVMDHADTADLTPGLRGPRAATVSGQLGSFPYSPAKA
jgi:hypothetical protein